MHPCSGGNPSCFLVGKEFGVTRERIRQIEARGFESLAGVTGTLGGIAHFAPLGGMLFGFLLLLYWGKHPLKR